MTEPLDDVTDRPPPVRRSLLLILPALAFTALAAVFFLRLRSGVDPAALPSAMIGRPVPHFDLPAVPGLTAGGAPVRACRAANSRGRSRCSTCSLRGARPARSSIRC